MKAAKTSNTKVSVRKLKLNDKKLSIPENTRSYSRKWSCPVCDGDEETGCLMSDPQSCPYN